jgi:hypothetical protein
VSINKILVGRRMIAVAEQEHKGDLLAQLNTPLKL